MSEVLKPPPLSVCEFLAWDPGDGQSYELADGEPRVMAPASLLQGLLRARLATLITQHFARARPHCSLVVAPGVVPRVLSSHNMRVPTSP